MLPIEKEMIGLIMRGASTPLDNIRVSVFLVAWSASLLAILRTVQNGWEAQAATKENDPEILRSTFNRPADNGKAETTQDGKGGDPSLQPAKRRA
jgi:hypothetical protein